MRALAVVVLVGVCGTHAHAAERVPLGENFSVNERVAVASLAVVGVGLFAAQHTFLAERNAVWTEPPEWDRRVSDALYRGEDAGRFLARVPDITGYVAPLAAGVFYLGDATLVWSRGAGFGGDLHADHELLAFAEAMTVTLFLNQATKVAISRLRPEYALGRRPGDDPRDDPESTVSFYSMHTSMSFCVAGFVARDLGDWLTSERLAAASPAERLWLGRVLPSVGLYGAAALVGLSRIVDQRHYPSDVTVGALMGAASSNLFYAAHFDGVGRPRRHPWRFGVAAGPGHLALHGTF